MSTYCVPDAILNTEDTIELLSWGLSQGLRYHSLPGPLRSVETLGLAEVGGTVEGEGRHAIWLLKALLTLL